MRYLKKIIALLLCISVFSLVGCGKNNKPSNETEPQKKVVFGYEFPVVLYKDVSIEDCFLYSGEYSEDASFEACKNVVALKVKNNGESDIQLLRIKVTTDSKEMLFEITTLTAGSSVTVLEKEKQTLAEDEKITNISGENRADFKKKITLNEELFLIQGNQQTINIKNISTKDIDGDIYIYYKKKDSEGKFFGGITFRTKAGGLKADEIKQLPASNFNPQDSEVLFVDYAEQ